MCSRLNDSDKSFVTLIGVYSTREHPFALVFEFVDRLNLRRHLGNNQNIGRLELVRIPSSYQSPPNVSSSRHQLLEVARGLKYMHSLGIVHGNLEIVRPILARRFRSFAHVPLDQHPRGR